jgi:DNA-binding winged helix-turn-helix (wHTH) protein
VARVIFRFGEFTLDLHTSRLLRAGQPVDLQPKTFTLLHLLLESAGQLVSREQIEALLWPDVVVTDDSLFQALRKLRVVLGDDARTPRFIETVPKRGYRWVGAVVREGTLQPAPRRPLCRPDDPFVGRQRERDALREALQGSRLVTLTGPGGIGKTRLALSLPEVGVVCELGAVTDPAGLLVAMSRGLGLPSSADPNLVLSALRECDAVVLLDEAEGAHELVARMVTDWLAALPALRLLITSRVRLSLAQERCLELGPLNVGEGVALYLARARQTEPQAHDDEDEVRALVEALDAFPLAIELAAARSPLMGAAALHRRLSSLSILSRPRPDRPLRHHSMEAALSWSWSMLSESERMAAARLSLFVGGMTLESAEHVLSDLGEPLGLLESLRHSSWLLRDGERLVQYTPLRLFASAQLDVLGREEATERFVQAMLAHLDVQLGVSTSKLAADRENLWAAFRMTSHPERACRLVQGLVRIDVYARGSWDHLHTALGRAQELARDAPLLQSGVIEQRARLALRDDAAGALRHAERALQLAGDAPTSRAMALRSFSMALPDGDPSILSTLQEAITLARTAGAPLVEAGALGNLGLALPQWGRNTDALEVLTEAVRCWRELGLPWQEAQALFWLCGPAAKVQDLDLLQRSVLRAMEIFHPRHDATLYAECLRYLALLARWEGRLDDAEALLLQMEEQGRISWLILPALPVRLRAEIAIERGNVVQARDLLDHLPKDPYPSTLGRAEAAVSEMLLLVAEGHLAGARDNTAWRAEVFREKSHRGQEAACQTWRALLCAALGDAPGARRWSDVALGLLDESLGPAVRGYALLAEAALLLVALVCGEQDHLPELQRLPGALTTLAPRGPTTQRPAVAPELRAALRFIQAVISEARPTSPGSAPSR